MPKRKNTGDKSKSKRGKDHMTKNDRIFHSRKYNRVPLEMDVEYINGDELVSGKSRDISVGGMYIESMKPLPGGSDTKVRFVLDAEGEAVEIEGKVAWTNDKDKKKLDTHPTGMGIEFVVEDADKRKVIVNFVRDLTDILRIMAFTNKRKDN